MFVKRICNFYLVSDLAVGFRLFMLRGNIAKFYSSKYIKVYIFSFFPVVIPTFALISLHFCITFHSFGFSCHFCRIYSGCNFRVFPTGYVCSLGLQHLASRALQTLVKETLALSNINCYRVLIATLEQVTACQISVRVHSRDFLVIFGFVFAFVLFKLNFYAFLLLL